MNVYGVVKNASDLFIIRVNEEFQTLIVAAVDNVLFQSFAQGLVNRGTVALCRLFDGCVADCTVTVAIEMQVQVLATHTTL